MKKTNYVRLARGWPTVEANKKKKRKNINRVKNNRKTNDRRQ